MPYKLKSKLLIVLFFVIALLYCLTPLVFAETIVLKTGKQVAGKLVEKTDQYIKLACEGVPVTFFLDEVDTINGEKVFLPVKQPATELKKEPTALKKEEVASSNIIKEGMVPMATQESVDLPKKILPDPVPMRVDSSRINTMRASALPWMITIFLIIYAYSGFCLYQIAGKTGTQNRFFAWIPIVSLILMIKIAGKPLWWFLLCLIPYINIIMMVILWMEIARACKKPSWVGLLIIVPILGFIAVPGYLAFSESNLEK